MVGRQTWNKMEGYFSFGCNVLFLFWEIKPKWGKNGKRNIYCHEAKISKARREEERKLVNSREVLAQNNPAPLHRGGTFLPVFFMCNKKALLGLKPGKKLWRKKAPRRALQLKSGFWETHPGVCAPWNKSDEISLVLLSFPTRRPWN